MRFYLKIPGDMCGLRKLSAICTIYLSPVCRPYLDRSDVIYSHQMPSERHFNLFIMIKPVIDGGTVAEDPILEYFEGYERQLL